MTINYQNYSNQICWPVFQIDWLQFVYPFVIHHDPGFSLRWCSIPCLTAYLSHQAREQMNPWGTLGTLRKLWTCSNFCDQFLLSKYLMKLNKRIHRPYVYAWMHLLLKYIYINLLLYLIGSNINSLQTDLNQYVF